MIFTVNRKIGRIVEYETTIVEYENCSKSHVVNRRISPLNRSILFSDLAIIALFSTASTHGHFVLSPVPLVSRKQDSGPSTSAIDIYDPTRK